jgi:glycosyltransferase involved in cell wall biosynthesis
MTGQLIAAVLLAVAAAGGFAVSAWLQHGAVSCAAGGWREALQSRRWLAGAALAAVSAGLHAVALALAPLVVVQPIGVIAIAGSAALAARSAGARISRASWAAIGTCMAGVGLFVVLAAANPGQPSVPAGSEPRATAVAAILLLLLAVAGRRLSGRLRCLAYASAAAVAYGLVSVLIRIGATRGFGLSAVAIALALLAGAFLVQQAYAAGPPQVVVATQTVVDPLAGIAIGVALLGEGAGMGPLTAAALMVSGLVAAGGVIALASQRSAVPVGARPVAGERLRIVIGADTFPPDINGAANFAFRLARGLDGEGHEVHVLCPATAAGPVTETLGGIRVHRVASTRTPFHPEFRVCLPWDARKAAGALLDELNPDVVHVQAHFLVGRALAGAAGERGVPLVATNHFMPENLFGHGRVPAWLQNLVSGLAWRDLRRVFGRAQAVTAPTPTAVRVLDERGLPGATAVSCGLDLSRYADPVKSGQNRVLFVGRLDEEKHVDELLRAAALLADRHPFPVDVVGDGTQRATLVELARELGIAHRVTFHGFVDEDELVAAYRRSDIFCMPGTAELQSLATMEAMAAGTPVVAADALALPHLVRPGRNGWLFPPGDVTALADRLERLLTSPDERRRMGAESRAIIADHALPVTLATFTGIYRAVTGAPRAGRAVAV